MVNLENIRKRTQSAKEYIISLEGKWKDIQLEEFQNYRLDVDTTQKLKVFAEKIVVVVIGASWCKDCRIAVPVLMKLEEEIGLEVRIFGTVKTAPLNPNHQWAVPPSPPEVDEWGVTAIPWIEVFDKKGNRIGTIIETPKYQATLENEILYVLRESSRKGKIAV